MNENGKKRFEIRNEHSESLKYQPAVANRKNYPITHVDSILPPMKKRMKNLNSSNKGA